MSAREKVPGQETKDEGWGDEKKLAVYAKYFDRWTHSRDERTDYNHFFITLLFANTLVAVLVALASGKITPTIAGFTRTLAIVVFAAAGVISIIWAVKLEVLNEVDDVQIRVLSIMEEDFPKSFRVVGQEDTLETPVQLPKKVLHKIADTLNYYGIACLLSISFVVLFFVAWLSPAVLGL